MFDRVRKADRESLFDDVSIICFNYDRCIEQYLTHEVAKYYSLTWKESSELVSNLSIIRPYGAVGRFISDQGQELPYGADVARANLFELSRNIRSFTEQQVDESVSPAIQRSLSEANLVVFLGFGFHSDNMKILKADDPTKVQQVIATAKGMSKSDQDIVKGQIMNSMNSEILRNNRNVIVSGFSCNDLFNEYRLTLRAR